MVTMMSSMKARMTRVGRQLRTSSQLQEWIHFLPTFTFHTVSPWLFSPVLLHLIWEKWYLPAALILAIRRHASTNPHLQGDFWKYFDSKEKINICISKSEETGWLRFRSLKIFMKAVKSCSWSSWSVPLSCKVANDPVVGLLKLFMVQSSLIEYMYSEKLLWVPNVIYT